MPALVFDFGDLKHIGQLDLMMGTRRVGAKDFAKVSIELLTIVENVLVLCNSLFIRDCKHIITLLISVSW